MQSLRERATTVFLIVWWCAYLYNYTRQNANDLTVAIQAIEGGSLLTQILILSLAAYGLLLMLFNRQKLRLWRRTWFKWLVAYVVWSGITLIWSRAPELSIRRYGAFLAVLAGTLGLGAAYFQDRAGGMFALARVVCAAGTSAGVAIMALSLTELTPSNLLNPVWAPSVRSLGPYLIYAVSFGILAAFALGILLKQRLYYLPLGLQISALLLFKSRSLTAFVLLTVLTMWTITLVQRKYSLTLVLAVAIVVPLAYVGHTYDLGDELLSVLMPYLQRGDSVETFDTLNGRLPLWSYLSASFWGNPFGGVGFGAFWTPQQVVLVRHAVGWQAPVAHNGFLDEALGTGLPGLLLLILVLVYGMRDLWRASFAQSTRSEGTVFGMAVVLLYILFNMTDTVTQFYFRFPFLCVVCAFACGATATTAAHKSLRALTTISIIPQPQAGPVHPSDILRARPADQIPKASVSQSSTKSLN